MRNYFWTGLALLLPFALTLSIAIAVINFLTSPLQGVVENILHYYGILDQPFLLFSGKQVLHFNSKVLALFFLFLFTILIGFFGQMFLVTTLLKAGDYIIQKIPVVNKIYKAFKEIVSTVFGSKKTAFDQVVLVPYPTPHSYSIGLLSTKDVKTDDRLAIFVPGSPNPTMGFMLNYKRDEIMFLSMTVEEAFKFIVSLGIKDGNFQTINNTTLH